MNKKTSKGGGPKLSESSMRDLRIREETNSGYAPKKRKFDLEERLLEFAVAVIELTEDLPNTRAANHIAGQLLRCGTSPYGHHGEVESAESRKDFVHKLKVCLKELRETRRWLLLLSRLKKMNRSPRLVTSLPEAEELNQNFRRECTDNGAAQPMTRRKSKFCIRGSTARSRRLSEFGVRCSVFSPGKATKFHQGQFQRIWP